MILLLFIAISFIFLISNEFLKRRFLISTHITRKIAHIGAAFIAFISPLFLNRSEIITLSLIFIVVMFLTRGTNFFSSIQAVKRRTLGEIFLPLGVILCAIFFLPYKIKAFQFGILIMGISDGFAGLIGEEFGKHYFKIFNSRKSIEGTCIFFATSLILTFLFISGFDYRILIIPLILTIIEFFLEYGLDNLILPILSAYLIHFLI